MAVRVLSSPHAHHHLRTRLVLLGEMVLLIAPAATCLQSHFLMQNGSGVNHLRVQLNLWGYVLDRERLRLRYRFPIFSVTVTVTQTQTFTKKTLTPHF